MAARKKAPEPAKAAPVEEPGPFVVQRSLSFGGAPHLILVEGKPRLWERREDAQSYVDRQRGWKFTVMTRAEAAALGVT